MSTVREKSSPIPFFRHIGRDHRAGTALFIALSAPVLVGVLALGLEVGGWAATRLSIQRAANVSALAGAINYNLTTDQQKATLTAARMAQMNGASGAVTPSWNATTKTLVSGMIMVEIVSGIQ